MKEKIERFNQDEQLRDMAYKKELKSSRMNEINRTCMKRKRRRKKLEGIKQEKYNLIKQLFNKYYPKEDDSILENLNSEQYDKIFEMILDNQY